MDNLEVPVEEGKENGANLRSRKVGEFENVKSILGFYFRNEGTGKVVLFCKEFKDSCLEESIQVLDLGGKSLIKSIYKPRTDNNFLLKLDEEFFLYNTNKKIFQCNIFTLKESRIPLQFPGNVRIDSIFKAKDSIIIFSESKNRNDLEIRERTERYFFILPWSHGKITSRITRKRILLEGYSPMIHLTPSKVFPNCLYFKHKCTPLFRVSRSNINELLFYDYDKCKLLCDTIYCKTGDENKYPRVDNDRNFILFNATIGGWMKEDYNFCTYWKNVHEEIVVCVSANFISVIRSTKEFSPRSSSRYHELTYLYDVELESRTFVPLPPLFIVPQGGDEGFEYFTIGLDRCVCLVVMEKKTDRVRMEIHKDEEEDCKSEEEEEEEEEKTSICSMAFCGKDERQNTFSLLAYSTDKILRRVTVSGIFKGNSVWLDVMNRLELLRKGDEEKKLVTFYINVGNGKVKVGSFKSLLCLM